MTDLKLYDGAIVRLRNGTQCTISANEGGQSVFPWTCQGEVPRKCWTTEGRFVASRQLEHPYDIVEVLTTPMQLTAPAAAPTDDEIQKKRDQQISGSLASPQVIQASKTHAEQVIGEGEPPRFTFADTIYHEDLLDDPDWFAYIFNQHNFTMARLTHFQGELFDSQRHFVWDAKTGKCKHCPDRWDNKPEIFDITGLRFKVPAGQIKTFKITNDNTSTLVGPKQFSDPVPVDEVDAWVTTRHLFAEYKPRKPVMKMMVTMAEALGGTYKRYRWISSSEIEFDVLFETFQNDIKGAGRHVSYTKQVRIKVSDAENNATIPMKTKGLGT